MKRDESWYFGAPALVTENGRYEVTRVEVPFYGDYVVVDRWADALVIINGRKYWPFQRGARDALRDVVMKRARSVEWDDYVLEAS